MNTIHPKILELHLKRLAVIYIRQSSPVQLSDMVDNSTSLCKTIFGLIFLHAAGEQVAFPPKQVCFCLVKYGTSHLRAMSFQLPWLLKRVPAAAGN